MTTVLVTGGAGFIGSSVVDRLLARGDHVVALDNFNDYYDPARKRRNLLGALAHPGFRLVEGDVRDEATVERVFAEEAIDKVIHIAAMAGVRPSIERPLLYQDVNVRGLLVVLEACRRHPVRGFVFASTSSVYGAEAPVPFREDDPAIRPVSPYAATKRAGELLCFTFHTLHRTPITCLRFFTVYGPRGRPDMAPYLFVQRVLSGQPIRMFGDGSTMRDYTYVDDIVSGVVAALDAELPFEIINLGNSDPIYLRDFIAVVEETTGRQAQIERDAMQPGDVPRTFADITKARRLLGYE
ncbi:MAG: SDR family NAD(P)-dependent oxidoreductase, partial [Thermomicrobiaceae bacterium]|nr:SDR family NAD(P)-dependent oxidoreductase [Thermomicrobiaceae bacterium]